MTLGARVFLGAFLLAVVVAVVVVFAWFLLRISAPGPGQGGSAAGHRPGTVYYCTANKRCEQVYPKP